MSTTNETWAAVRTGAALLRHSSSGSRRRRFPIGIPGSARKNAASGTASVSFDGFGMTTSSSSSVRGLLTQSLQRLRVTTQIESQIRTTATCTSVQIPQPEAAVTPRSAPVSTTQRLPGLISPSRDRRAFPRRESGCQVAICIQAPDHQLTSQQVDWQLHAGKTTGRLVDVSMNGISLHLDQPLDAQAKVYLRVSNRHLDQSLDTAGTVLRSKQGDDGQWTIICRLDKNFTFEQIHTIGKQLFASTIV